MWNHSPSSNHAGALAMYIYIVYSIYNICPRPAGYRRRATRATRAPATMHICGKTRAQVYIVYFS